MTIRLDEIRPHLLEPQLSDRRLASYLDKIKVMYTIDRKGLPTKKWSRAEVSAYSSFYMTTNAAKFEWLMDQLPESVKDDLSECDVVDFGTGPGTYLLAFAQYFNDDYNGRFIGVDKEPLMIEQAQKVVDGLYPKIPKTFYEYLPAFGPSDKRLLIFGNSCNEMSVREINEVIQKVTPSHILFIEPGTPVVYDQMMTLREKFKENNYHCVYPCPSIKMDCPIKKRIDSGQEDWCHQVWRGTHDANVERLGQMAKIDRKAMAMIAHLYTLKDYDIELPSARFVRYLNESKHAFTWEVCLKQEDELSICQFEVPKKTLSKQETKEMKKIGVGVHFKYELIKKISDNHLRVKISL